MEYNIKLKDHKKTKEYLEHEVNEWSKYAKGMSLALENNKIFNKDERISNIEKRLEQQLERIERLEEDNLFQADKFVDNDENQENQIQEETKQGFLRGIQLKTKIAIVKQRAAEREEIKNEISSYASKGRTEYTRVDSLTPAMIKFLKDEGFKIEQFSECIGSNYINISWLDKDDLVVY